jgi:catechol 2,3-dioxygenase-like lactoylglutathione lyase family enzyme
MKAAAVRGLNHLTLAVSDLARSLRFYEQLGFKLAAQWPEGAYLEAGGLWLCLSLDQAARTSPHPDYTHIALDVGEDDFPELAGRMAGVPIWKENRNEGASLYLLDPDGHKLELHVGSLESRLAHYRANPVAGRWVAPE